MSEQNKKLVRRITDEILNQGNLAVVDERFAGDYVGHTFTEIQGPEGVKKQFVSPLRSAFPDLHYIVEDQLAEGDKVATRWTCQGTHEGTFQGVPPTGKEVTFVGMTIFRVANGKIVEGWTNADMLGLMQQLGAVPAPEHA